jgi:hypothetical protein
LKTIVMVCLLVSCVHVPPQVDLRREAGMRLESCLGTSVGWRASLPQRSRCIEESIAWCRSHDLEDGCGASELYGRSR